MADQILTPIFAILTTSALYYFCSKILKDIVVPGLKSGNLQAKGVVYSRREQPLRFWFGICFWFLTLAILLFATLVFVLNSIHLILEKV